MAFQTEPPYTHGALPKTAVVLVNLGTPEAPTAAAVRPYLKQFLSDSRVVEIPKALWWFILNGIILPLRAGKSAAKYATIWTPDGSPLKVYTERQAKLLQGYLGERGHQLHVTYAMSYGNPALPAVLERLKTEGCERILILPAYPQYSSTTTASVFDAVFGHYRTVRNIPELRLVKHYHDHPGYIDALTQSVFAHWHTNGRPDKLVMSFHGVPKHTLALGDPYHCECYKTARLLANALGLTQEQYLVTFQSRFGKAEWLQPYTAPSLQKLAKEGVARVDLICPGFTSDCLETLEEIAIEARHDFLAAGGRDFHYIGCLNDSPAWIHALADIVLQHTGGWPTANTTELRDAQNDAAQIARTESARMGARG